MLAEAAARLATVEDAEVIAALSRDLIEYGMPWRWRPERIRHVIRDPNTNVVAVGKRGSPVGFGVMEYQEDEAHLLLFAVATEYQRKGVGSVLLRWLEDVARAAGAQRIQVEARRENEAARCFYNEHGYHEWVVERGMYRPTIDGVRLEKWLRPVMPSGRSDA
jgi:ribosomal-protein-alanine N-acetyltransferase